MAGIVGDNDVEVGDFQLDDEDFPLEVAGNGTGSRPSPPVRQPLQRGSDALNRRR